MIYIIVSSKHEKNCINEKLVKINDKFYDIYENSNIKLIISGVGTCNASAAISYICKTFEPKRNDVILNFGFAGSYDLKEINQIYRINVVKDICQNENLYFDMTYDLGIKEKNLITVPKPVERSEMKKNILYDMEGFAFYKVSRNFFDRQNIFAIKKISDNGKSNFELKNIISNNELDEIIKKLNEISIEYEKIYKLNDLENIKKYLKKSNFTKVQKDLLIKKIYQLLLKGKDINDLLKKLVEIDFNNKKERNLYFEQIIKS